MENQPHRKMKIISATVRTRAGSVLMELPGVVFTLDEQLAWDLGRALKEGAAALSQGREKPVEVVGEQCQRCRSAITPDDIRPGGVCDDCEHENRRAGEE